MRCTEGWKEDGYPPSLIQISTYDQDQHWGSLCYTPPKGLAGWLASNFGPPRQSRWWWWSDPSYRKQHIHIQIQIQITKATVRPRVRVRVKIDWGRVSRRRNPRPPRNGPLQAFPAAGHLARCCNLTHRILRIVKFPDRDVCVRVCVLEGG
jgi:hypothetical protein